jgi:hypothetical protein
MNGGGGRESTVHKNPRQRGCLQHLPPTVHVDVRLAAVVSRHCLWVRVRLGLVPKHKGEGGWTFNVAVHTRTKEES